MKRYKSELTCILGTVVIGVALMAVLLLVGCSNTPQRVQLYDGFGNYQRPITTKSANAQQWFNQGMKLLYGFNHDEAIRSFEQAGRLDPTAAMPWWGVAYAHGININDPAMTGERSRLAREAADKAMDRLKGASPAESALINAVDQRYAHLPTKGNQAGKAPADRKPLDQAYANAMANAYAQFKSDPDIGALYAESLMNLQPWDYWDNDGNPKGKATEFVGVLEKVMQAHPDHPGANHFYIHAVEASKNPNRAVPAADRNYFSKAPKPRMYAVYYAHNLHFLSYAAMMAGRYKDALKAARDLEREMPKDALKSFAPLIEGIMPSTFHVMIRFGKWHDILKEPDYPDYRLVSKAVRRYARSIANSALGNTKAARVEMTAFENAMANIPADWYIFNNQVAKVLPIGQAMIKGELLFREGKLDEAFAILRKGAEAEDALVYDEPPAWMLPVRHALGALLMSAKRYKEAEAVYRQDLARNRDNGWGLLGLQQSLLAQGKLTEATKLGPRVAKAFADTDVKPTSSCYCEPGRAIK
jgi:tetratricopeptide (TPR) repeat protein